MKTYLTDAGLLVRSMSWTEYQSIKKAREITPEPKTLNLSYNKPRAGSIIKEIKTNVTQIL